MQVFNEIFKSKGSMNFSFVCIRLFTANPSLEPQKWDHSRADPTQNIYTYYKKIKLIFAFLLGASQMSDKY